MPLTIPRLKQQQEILYPPSVGYGYVALLDVTEDSFTFTVNPTGDIFSASGHNFVNGTRVKVSSTLTVPAPLVADTIYYVRDVSGSTFKLAATRGGAAIDITDSGTGTLTITDVIPDKTIGDTSEWIRKEITYTGGATRQPYTPLAVVEDPTNDRVYTPEVSLVFANSGGASMVFDGVILIAGGVVTPGNTTGTIDLFTLFDFPQTIANGESRIIKVPNIYANAA